MNSGAETMEILHHSRLLHRSVKFTEEGGFEFSSRVIGAVVAFEYFVDPLKEERPETMEGSKVLDTLRYMGAVVVIWSNHVSTIKLQHTSVSNGFST